MIIIFIFIIIPILLSLSLYALLKNLNGKFKKIVLVSALYTILFIIIASYMNQIQPGDPLVIILGLILLTFSIACPSAIAVFYFKNTFERKYEMAEAFFFPLVSLPYLAFFISPELIEGQPLPPDYFQSIIPLFGWFIDPVFKDAGLAVSPETSIITGLISDIGIFFEVLITLFVLCIIMRKIKETVDNVGS
ncbi:hypothetical protein Mpet_0244 [Methanolacinia petrolearia DSM 11571]|uniref:Uncharacterized protein n=2 Tax=Methanolacinia TaxID=230355 RepID=E1RF74_METP4|nr:hypothetical protein Mpet_0244 [Methanolacinia petrolearia DSM 11571]